MKPRLNPLPDYAGLYGLVVFLILVRFAGPKSLLDGDTLFHIRFGQIMLERGQILREDIFSHTAHGQPWIAHEWLSEVIMAAIYNLGGLAAVSITFFLVAALSFTLLYRTTRSVSNDWSAFVVISLAAVPMAYTHLLARPHLFTWLLGVLTLHLLICDDRRIWLLPLITAVWVNLHGGVLLGLLLQGAFLAGRLFDNWPAASRQAWTALVRDNRRPLLVLAASILALGLNPFGFYPLWFNQHVSADIFAGAIGEWKSPNFNSMWYVRLWMIGVFILALWYGRKTTWTWRLLVPLLIYQALGHVRHVSIAALCLAPWMALALRDLASQIPFKPWFRRADKPQLVLSAWSGPVLTVTAYTLLLGLSITNPPFWNTFTEKRFPLPEDYSQGVIDFLEKGAPGQKLLNGYSWGDYLIYALEDPPPLFIDGRADMYGEEIFKDYLTVTNLDKESDLILKKYAIDWVLFPADHALVRYLNARGNWNIVYKDEQAAILVLAQKT